MIGTGTKEETIVIDQTPECRRLFAAHFDTEIAKMIDTWIREKMGSEVVMV